MSRNNPIGQGGQPPWRHPAEQEPFNAQPAPQQPQGYGYQQQPPGQGYYFPPAEQAPAQPPFGHFQPAPPVPYPPPQEWGPQQPDPRGPDPRLADPRGYDLGSYMPADQQGYAPAPPSQYPQHGPHGYGDADPDFDDMVEDDEEEPRSGRRALMIVAALVGAIGLGGGLAYTYKTFILGKGGRPQVIKTADLGASKVKPTTPGGKEFAHTDKKLLNRLDDPNGRQASDAQDRAGEDRDAPRKVKVIDIKPGEQGPTGIAVAPSAPVTVPGLMIDNLGPQPPPGAVRAGPPPSAPPQASVQPPPARVVVQPPPVKVVARSPEPQEEAPQPPRQTARAAPAKVALARPAPAAPQTTAASGYVAVLSSQKSRMDALKVFADMQQKYGEVLLSRTPDVREADLSARGLGTMYRLVVGPPGSRDAASGVCHQLKSVGYQGCWVMAY
jgi:SPOR domain